MVELAPDEIIRRIETCDAWMVLKHVESDPAYRALLEEALMTVARAQGHASLEDAGYSDIQGFIFVSSPHSTTPFHADNEDNFFVQIHGDKFFHVFDNTDRSIASEEMLEDVVVKHRNLTYDPLFDVKATHYHLKPGDGIFVPYQWPHYVQTSDTYSISLAMTWKTEEVRRRNDIFVVNSMLRGLGMSAVAAWHAAGARRTEARGNPQRRCDRRAASTLRGRAPTGSPARARQERQLLL